MGHMDMRKQGVVLYSYGYSMEKDGESIAYLSRSLSTFFY